MKTKLTKREQSKQNNIVAIQIFKNQGYSVAETAEFLRLSKRTVYRYWDNEEYKIFKEDKQTNKEKEVYFTKEKFKYIIEKEKDLDTEWNNIISNRKEKANYTTLKSENGKPIVLQCQYYYTKK